jgi:cell division protein FtsB
MTSTPAPARSKASWDTAASLAAAAAEQQKLDKENKVLRERAEDLQDEVEVLRAKLEEAKAMSADLPQREEE